MAVDFEAIRNVIISHALASGYFEWVSGHEPKSKPPNGLTAAVLLGETDTLPDASGMATVSIRQEFILRIHINMLAEPQDDIDTRHVGAALNSMLTALIGDFTLGGQVREVDLLGAHGQRLRARPGYLNISGTMFRINDLLIPCVVNDAFTQAA